MVNKQHIWAQPSTHDGRHANMLGADVVRCNQYKVPRTRYQIKNDLLNLIAAIVTTVFTLGRPRGNLMLW